MMINHADMVRTLVKSGAQLKEELTPEQAHVQHMAIGISGEAGELLDGVKKWTVYQKPLDRENIVEELGDLEFYMEGLRQGLDITREETLDHNIAKLGKRYQGFKYSNEAAQARADKQPEYIVGQIVRTGNGSTALLKIERFSGARVYGTHCMGGPVGANLNDITAASGEDLQKWDEVQ